MTADPGATIADEWLRIARKDWRRAERNLTDRDPVVKSMFPSERLLVLKT